MNQSKIDGFPSIGVRQQGTLQTRAVDGGGRDVISPRNGRLPDRIAAADREDVDLAAASARSGFDGGSCSTVAPADRKRGADVTVPRGGVGRSGNGHDTSPHAPDKFADLKTAWIQL
jgi:acyl-CoA reductase-like NAD-dependent aldehyde dehydrogenase